MSALIKMENDDPLTSPSMESWEDVSVNTPIDNGTLSGRNRKDRDLRTTIHVERGKWFILLLIASRVGMRETHDFPKRVGIRTDYFKVFNLAEQQKKPDSNCHPDP